MGEFTELDSHDSWRDSRIDPSNEYFAHLEAELDEDLHNLGFGCLRRYVSQLQVFLQVPLDFDRVTAPVVRFEEPCKFVQVPELDEAEATVSWVELVSGEIDFLHVTELTHELS